MKILLGALCFAWLFAAVPCPAVGPVSGPVAVVRIDGQVSKAQHLFLRRAIKEAESSRAGAILLHMDTYGGDLHAAVSIVDALGKTKLPTLTFVDRNAGSAGALIALGTDRIYMAPVSAIGAAAPVMGGGENLPEAMNEKVVSYFSKYFRSAAERKGHNPEIAEAFVNKDKEVKLGERVLSEKGALLTLSPQEAVEKFDGKPVLAEGIAEDVPGVLVAAGLSAQTVRIEPTGFETVALWVTALAPLFLIAGLAGLYIEFKTPGFGLPGILGGLSLLVFFLGHQVAGLAGLEVFAVFVLGVMLVVAEVIFFPGVVVLALVGVMLAIGALFWAMVDRYPAEVGFPSLDALVTPAVNLGLAFGGGTLVILVLANFLPRTTLFRHLVLDAVVSEGANLKSQTAGSARSVEVGQGQRGTAYTRLCPGGRARFGDRLVDVMAEGSFVNAGEPVTVLAVEGSRILVTRV